MAKNCWNKNQKKIHTRICLPGLLRIEMPWFCLRILQYKYRRPDQKADGEGIEYLIGKTNKTVSATFEIKLRRKSSPRRPIKLPLHESSSEHTHKVPKMLY